VKKLLLSFFFLATVTSASWGQGIYINVTITGGDPSCQVTGITATYATLPDSAEQGMVQLQMMGALTVFGGMIPTAAPSAVVSICPTFSPNCPAVECLQQIVNINTNNVILFDVSGGGGGTNDADGDGYTGDLDCDDNNPLVNAGMPEICNDFMDNNCDGVMDEGCNGGQGDNDNDGFSGVFDCNDNDASINPNAAEICGDSIDNNCNILVDEGCNGGFTDADMDGFDSSVDCNDFDFMINPGMAELCADMIDNNCNGAVDEEGCTGGNTGGCNPNIILFTDSAAYAANPGTVWILNMIDPNTMFSYFWDFGDGNSSTNPFPTNFYALSGTYTVCLTVTDPSGCTGLTCITFTVTPEGDFLPGGMPMTGFTLNVVSAIPSNVANTEANAALEVYPNPIGEQSTLRWNGMPNEQGTLEIVSMDGRVIFCSAVASLAGERSMQLPYSEMAGGVYLVRLRSASGFSKTIQLIK
jgi:PKD domain/Putative metal-binding motif/Secretion system C-terminal sorting domain